MRNALSLVVLALALCGTSQSFAGTTGNGAAQRNGIKPVPKTYYSFCFGGLRKVVYFSPVFASAPSVNKPDLGVPFGKYLTQTYGVGSNNGGQCFASEAKVDAENGKKKHEADLGARAWKVVETKWTGLAASPGTPAAPLPAHH